MTSYHFSIPVNQSFLENKNLSPTARLLYIYCKDKPEDWIFNFVHIAKALGLNKSTVYSALNELIEHRFCCREELRVKGQFSSSRYVFFKEPYPRTSDTVNSETSHIGRFNNKENNSRDVAAVSSFEEKLHSCLIPAIQLLIPGLLEAADNVCYGKDNLKSQNPKQSPNPRPDKPLKVIKKNSNDPLLDAIIAKSQESKDPFTPELLRNLSYMYGIEKLESQLNNYRRTFTSKGTKADNPGGWLTSAVKNNYDSAKLIYTEAQREALNFNKTFLEKGLKKLYDENEKLIKEQKTMKILFGGRPTSISLNNPIEVLRNDFKMSYKEMYA